MHPCVQAFTAPAMPHKFSSSTNIDAMHGSFLSPHPDAGTQDEESWELSIGTTAQSEHHTVLQTPHRDAYAADWKAYLNYQLDGLRGHEVFGGLVFHEGFGTRPAGGVQSFHACLPMLNALTNCKTSIITIPQLTGRIVF